MVSKSNKINFPDVKNGPRNRAGYINIRNLLKNAGQLIRISIFCLEIKSSEGVHYGARRPAQIFQYGKITGLMVKSHP